MCFEFCLLIVYLTTLSVAQTMWRRVLGWVVNNELEMAWKEAVVTKFDIVIQCFPGGTKETLK
jgi:hypothetical protein